jgi:hypothetical protein
MTSDLDVAAKNPVATETRTVDTSASRSIRPDPKGRFSFGRSLRCDELVTSAWLSLGWRQVSRGVLATASSAVLRRVKPCKCVFVAVRCLTHAAP